MIFYYRLEWLHFLHLKTNRHIGNPVVTCSICLIIGCHNCADGGNLVKEKGFAGEHTICDINGNSLKLSNVKSGMLVKIRAKNVHWRGYEYLYTADGLYGKYFAIRNIKIWV